MSIFAIVSGFISIVIIAFAAYLANAPFIFPALGPTIFLIFSRPMSPAASPRNISWATSLGVSAAGEAWLYSGFWGKSPSSPQELTCLAS